MSRNRLCAAALFLALAAAPQRLNAAQAVSDVEQGKKLFQGLCVTCHGFDGAGGEAPPLNRPRLTSAPDEESLRKVISQGIPNRGMPRVRLLTDNELRQLVAYVRSLSQTPQPAPRGNAERGGEVYAKAGCASCHIVKGQGGSLGPALTEIGRLRGPQYLHQSIVDPAAVLPRGTLAVPGRGFTEFLPVLVVMRGGREVRGVRVNEDVFTIQLRDATNAFHSFRKSEVETIRKEPDKSLMPSYAKRLNARELDDLVAYLSSLRGEL